MFAWVVLSCGGEETYVPKELPPWDTSWEAREDTDTNGVPCSEDVGGPATVHIVNQTITPVDILWVDRSCVETWYGTLAPQQAYDQGTYVGHVWIAREAGGGPIVDTFVAESANAEWQIR